MPAAAACIAYLRNGDPCRYSATHDSYCGIHARLRTYGSPETLLESPESIATLRARRIAEEIAAAPTLSFARMLWFLQRLVDVWIDTPALRHVQVPLAYYMCLHTSIAHPGYSGLIQSVVRIVRQTRGYHPTASSYGEVPLEERNDAIAALHAALAAYDPVPNLRARLLAAAEDGAAEAGARLVAHMDFLEHESVCACLNFHTVRLRPLAAEKAFCPILQNTLHSGSLYTVCETCENAMDAHAAETALQTKRACPLCRAPWTGTAVYRAA